MPKVCRFRLSANVSILEYAQDRHPIVYIDSAVSDLDRISIKRQEEGDCDGDPEEGGEGRFKAVSTDDYASEALKVNESQKS